MTYVLGGAQTDFARNIAKEGNGLVELLAEVVSAAVEDAGVSESAVEVAHIGNLAGELFTGQAQLGGLLITAVPERRPDRTWPPGRRDRRTHAPRRGPAGQRHRERNAGRPRPYRPDGQRRRLLHHRRLAGRHRRLTASRIEQTWGMSSCRVIVCWLTSIMCSLPT